jgi:hypothetical protein
VEDTSTPLPSMLIAQWVMAFCTVGPWALQAWSSLLSGSYLTLTHKHMHSLAKGTYFKCAVVHRLPKTASSLHRMLIVQRSLYNLHKSVD